MPGASDAASSPWSVRCVRCVSQVCVRDPQVPGRPHRFSRADLAYLEYPNGGAVFSAGAICWRASLSALDYGNTVSRVTENVLRRFADPTWRR
jgi:N,N-dimethylformamidase